MRVSIKKEDKGYTESPYKFSVYLNDIIRLDCITADEEKGFIVVIKYGSEKIIFGKVKIIKRDNKMKTLDWNDISKLGLVERINREILHPLGLSVSYDFNKGVSEEILISDDGFFEYSPEMPIREKISKKGIHDIIILMGNKGVI